MKKLLILGGTNFIGRVVVEQLLLADAYDITLFNRGKRNATLFPTVKRIVGDRETDDHLKIADSTWDCIIDFSGYYPQSFDKMLNALRDKVKRYIFVSTLSVYDMAALEGSIIDETTDILTCSNEQQTSPLPDAYGEKKAEMERVLNRQAWLDSIIIRPSFVYGKYDFTDRFYHWLWRGKKQHNVLLPDSTLHDFPITEVNQLSQGILNAIEVAEHSGIYNAVTFSDVTIRKIVESAKPEGSTIVYSIANEVFLKQHGVGQEQFPLYMPLSVKVDNSKWLADFRLQTPSTLLNEQTEKYYADLNWPEPKAGISLERERKLLVHLNAPV
ncbi:MAG: NAD(P)H-binding protein [Bacteroidetes bacterium]|nr:NAD(P)H-binding protein [Bacteroidota bacterium]